jgi:hypothetical protein
VLQITPKVRKAGRTLSGWWALKGRITLGSGMTSIIVCPSSSYIENCSQQISEGLCQVLTPLLPTDDSSARIEPSGEKQATFR